MSEKYQDEDWLWDMWSSDRTVKEIAEEANAGTTTIDTWVNKFDFPPKREAEGALWRDESWLRSVWHSDKTIEEIADEAGCSKPNIQKWSRRFDLPNRFEIRDRPWHNLETLKRLYEQELMTVDEIAEKFDVSRGTIGYWMDKYDIQRRSPSVSAAVTNPDPHLRMDKDGYERFIYPDDDGIGRSFGHHRLIAAAEYGIDSIKGMDVHHENGIEWDNRVENLTLLSHPDHMSHHTTLRNARGELEPPVRTSEDAKADAKNRERDEKGRFA